MADGTYTPKIYKTQGGEEMVVTTGATLTIESGATLNLQAV